MKKTTFILTVLIAIAISVNAQIPNSGFENWTTVGGNDSLTGGVWSSTNYYSSGPFYPVTKSTDHYPTDVGNYSIKIENNISILPSYGGYGAAWTGSLDYSGGAVFPITGHPTSFCGYYKYIPQNNDTLSILLLLYYNGNSVAEADLGGTTAVPSWTSFNIPLTTYTIADSASITIGAYNVNSYSGMPHGNSVLYVDNLSFDNLITSISEPTSENITFSLYPNPASDIVTLNIDNMNNTDLTLNIYNVTGTLVKSEMLKQNQQQINTGNLNNGIYMIEIKSEEWTEKQKLIIQR